MQLSPTKESKDTALLITEYNALRNEILKRMDMENQLMTFTVIVFGSVLGVGFQNKFVSLILLYPTMGMFLAVGWAHSDYMTRLMGKYIQDHIEAVVGVDNIGWEHYLTLNRPLSYAWTARGIFITTELLAIIAGISLVPLNSTFFALLLKQPLIAPNFTMNIILCIAFISPILTFLTLRQTTIKSTQMPIKLISLERDMKYKQ